MSDDEKYVSPDAAEVLEFVAGQTNPELMMRFYRSLLDMDPAHRFLQREVWKRFKLVGIHPDEDSELVQRTARMVKAGEFSMPS